MTYQCTWENLYYAYNKNALLLRATGDKGKKHRVPKRHKGHNSIAPIKAIVSNYVQLCINNLCLNIYLSNTSQLKIYQNNKSYKIYTV